MKARSPITRIFERITEDESGCWRYQGAHDEQGYGVISYSINGAASRLYVHRVVYEYLVVEIPAGLVLDHLCRQRDCCNFGHLEPVTIGVNCSRGYRPALTHCPKGHDYSGDNLEARVHRYGGISRDCRTCHVERSRKSRERARAGLAA